MQETAKRHPFPVRQQIRMSREMVERLNVQAARLEQSLAATVRLALGRWLDATEKRADG